MYLIFVINNKQILTDKDKWKRFGIYVQMRKWIKTRTNKSCMDKDNYLLKNTNQYSGE